MFNKRYTIMEILILVLLLNMTFSYLISKHAMSVLSKSLSAELAFNRLRILNQYVVSLTSIISMLVIEILIWPIMKPLGLTGKIVLVIAPSLVLILLITVKQYFYHQAVTRIRETVESYREHL
ncbi:hypothetical protein VN24_13825 [Paenibacillus beijingensis]|uniref:Uncharacterized protein n=1 Tax=Paenibacillus beijingensis TaxID=1126833 RepID=A0A0D5NJ95_9BACL|nr:hypothetical protein VN24_13825 [Paenibacillus beijingensis]